MEAKDFEIREMRGDEKAAGLQLRNAMFTPLTMGRWDAMGNTAAIAKNGAEVWGIIPLQFRDMLVAPGVSIPVVFENAVGVSDKARGMGIGTAMLDAAAEFMKDRVDALCVYRGGERSDGYRFYRKTHHGDLFFQQCLTLAGGMGADNNVEVHDAAMAVELEQELFAVFARCYKGFAGFWERRDGYFNKMLASHVYRNAGWKLYLLRSKQGIEAYAIINPECKRRKGPAIYDFAYADKRAFTRLLDKVAFAHRGAGLSLYCTREHPSYRILLDYGFSFESDSAYCLARVIDAGRIFQRLANGSPLLKELELTAATPHRDIVINKPEKPRYRAALFLKEAYLSRLLFSRLSLDDGLRMNFVRMTPLPLPVEKALMKVFRFTPWINFAIDYV